VQGVQLYTLRSLMEQDVAQTLAAVAKIGYRQVEFAGYFAQQPSALRKMLEAEGLSAPAAHLPLQTFAQQLDASIEAARELGHKYLVLPWLAPDQRSADDYRRLADQCNHWGEKCRDAGIRFAYHNHEFEFEANADFVPYHWLLEKTEPSLVSFEMDLFWFRKAGRDPLEYFKQYPGRFPLWHIKDMDAAGNMVDVGAGVIDFEKILARSEGAGLEYGFVEHDQPQDPLQTVTASLGAARAWGRG
jgi:sugar phosphate isomerase/epimerase